MGGFGAFGKIPALGDFLRMSLPLGFAEPWDAWVQAGLLDARAQLAQRWQACFFSAPIWRFTLAPQLAGPMAVQGVLMASVDRVGRQFPLTLAAALRGGANPDVFATHFAADTVFAALEELALEALEDTMTPKSLSDRLGAIQPTAALTAKVISPPVSQAGRVASLGVSHAGVLTNTVPQSLQTAGYVLPSIWTALWGGQTHVYVQSGMPAPTRMHDFYDSEAGLWQNPLTDGHPK